VASREVRTLDAIHVASARWVSADGVLAYDRRLAEAARAERFVVHAP
jgi:predicted nucleic acid-binding protein